MNFRILIAVLGLLSFSGCSNDDAPKYPSAAGAELPYILKEGCKFTIVSDQGSASVTSSSSSDLPGVSMSMSVSLGDMEIAVSNCEVVDNSHGLPIYEN